MAYKVNVKSKPPRFKGDQTSWYLTASGMKHWMTKALSDLLVLQGLTPMPEEDGRQTWSSRPQIGGYPGILAGYLQRKHGLSLTPEATHAVNLTFGERAPDDGLSHIFGKTEPGPGARRLTVAVGKDDFFVNCDADNDARISALEAARWLPIENAPPEMQKILGTLPFRTRDPIIAGLLEPWMTPGARKRLAEVFPQVRDNILNATREDAPDDFDIPSPEGLNYLDFQKRGIHTLARGRKSGIIADDMGLGKTIQGIGILNARPDALNVLVFCQANMKLKWARELKKWSMNQSLEVAVANGENFPDSDVVVINYDIALRNETSLRARKWDLILIDEAHNLKNEEAQRTQAILGELMEANGKPPLPLAKDGQIIMMSGTPAPNRIEELWSLVSTIAPDIFGRGPRARRIFLNRYEPPILIKRVIPVGGRQIEKIIPMAGNPVRLAELQMSLKGTGRFMRRMKNRMKNSGLPQKWRTPLDLAVRLSKEQKEVLRQAEADIETIVKDLGNSEVIIGEGGIAGAVIDVIDRLNPDSPAFYELARVRRNLGVLKAGYCADFILEELAAEKDFALENRTKTVIFAHHQEVIQILAEKLRSGAASFGIKGEKGKTIPGEVLIYDGKTGNEAKRQAVIDRFQEDDKVRAIIISLAGATGITLTAAARMRMVEFDWSPSNMVQIEDRIWRIGQMLNVDIGYMAIPGTLDSRMGDALITKMETNVAALDVISLEAVVRGSRRLMEEASRANPVDADNPPDERDVEQYEARLRETETSQTSFAF